MRRHGRIRSGRRNIYDTAPTAHQHARQARPDHLEGAIEIGLNHKIPVLITVVTYLMMDRNPRRIHQNIGFPVVRCHPIHKASNRIRVTYIQLADKKTLVG